MHIPARILALMSGIVGAAIGFVINILNSTMHFVGQLAGFTDNSGHLFIGSLVAFVAFIGALLVMVTPEVGGILLIICTIGFFFAIGWWALIPAPFLLVGAWLAMMARPQRRAAMS